MTPKIAYLLTLFPKISESFVLNEVVWLRRRGVQIVPISFSGSNQLEDKAHKVADELRGSVVYARDAYPKGHLAALAYWAVRKPVKLAKLFWQNWRHPNPYNESKLGRFSMTVYAARVIDREGATHLHAHWSYPGDIALFLHSFLGLSYSFTAHAHDIFEDIDRYKALGFDWEERLAGADFVVACTEYNRQFLQGLCPEREWPKLHRAYHGLDSTRFVPAPERFNRPPEHTPTLLSVGRFVPYKGFDVIVRACERLQKEGRTFRCWLLGSDGSQTEPIARQIKEAGLDGTVEMLGPKTQEELVELFKEVDIYVNASNPDGEYGVANVIVEGLAMGLPTIATFRPQVTEYIEHGVNGILLPYGDDAALAAAIAGLFDDPELGKRLAEKGRQTAVEHFDINATADLLQDLFSRIGQSAPQPQPAAPVRLAVGQ
jgi:glycosyltransferase involved in cell wall biosynthesis